MATDAQCTAPSKDRLARSYSYTGHLFHFVTVQLQLTDHSLRRQAACQCCSYNSAIVQQSYVEMSGEFSAAQIGSLLADDDDEELLGGTAAKKEREIIESNRVKLANYIHDVTTLFPLLRQEGIFNRDDVEIIGAHVTTTAKVDKCLDVLLRKGEPGQLGLKLSLLESVTHLLYLGIASLGNCYWVCTHSFSSLYSVYIPS